MREKVCCDLFPPNGAANVLGFDKKCCIRLQIRFKQRGSKHVMTDTCPY